MYKAGSADALVALGFEKQAVDWPQILSHLPNIAEHLPQVGNYLSDASNYLPVLAAKAAPALKALGGKALHTAGSTLGLHVGANSIFKMLRGIHAPKGNGRIARAVRAAVNAVPVGHNYETQSLAMGLRNGIQRKQLNPGLRSVMVNGLGPESAIMSDMGQSLGKGLAGKTPYEIKRALKQIRKGVATSPSMRETPLGAPMIGAINQFFEGPTQLERGLGKVGLGATPVGQKKTLAQRVVPAALGAGAVAAEPHSALHMGVNAIRQRMARSATGTKMMKDGFRDGALGKPQNPVARTAWDFGVSPAVLDARRTGEGANLAAQRREPGIRRLGGFLGRIGARPDAQQAAHGFAARAVEANPGLVDKLEEHMSKFPELGSLFQQAGIKKAP